MARIWMEGFEDGLPHGQYLEGSPGSNHINELSFSTFPSGAAAATGVIQLGAGRNEYSDKSLKINQHSSPAPKVTKTLATAKDEVYFRIYVKHEKVQSGTLYDAQEVVWFLDEAGNRIFSLYNANVSGPTDWALYVKTGGSYSKVVDYSFAANTWIKLEVYIKIGNGTGAYNIKINDVSVASNSGDNTGTSNLKSIGFGQYVTMVGGDNAFYFDDIALNDTAGTINNTWCGDGTIVALRPKGAGNYSQWDKSQGWTLAEASTTTTALMITSHGLANNDVIYNVTRDAYRIVTKTNDNELAVSAITGQVAGDVIVAFTNIATIEAGAGTSTSKVVISGHTLESYDCLVNTSRSNAIRRAIYIDGTSVFNSYAGNVEYPGSTVTSQASGDSIKTFKVKFYAISDHYKAVNTVNPNPQYANIQSDTSDDIDTFDMQELVADKSVPSNAGIIAASLNIYAKEKGAGSQVKPVLRISGTDYEGGAIALTSGTKEYQTVYDVSPATSEQWTIGVIDALEAGVKVV
jgi:hypothetical protein